MISLRELAALAAEHADDLDHVVEPFRIGEHAFDTDVEPVIMGVVNLSSDSWYHDSVAFTRESALRRAQVLVAQGAHLIDVGAESVQKAAERVDADDQSAALVPVIEDMVGEGIAVSVESYHPSVVEPCLAAGAGVLNLTGSVDDDAMFSLAAAHGASVVLCHIGGSNPRDLDPAVAQGESDPFDTMREQFGRRVGRARELGVSSVSIDPGVGFTFAWKPSPSERSRHQASVLLQSFRLRRLGLPICHSLPAAHHLFGDEFRTAEGFFTVLASLGGTGIYRTHEVPRIRAVLAAMHEFGVHPPAR
ncbi:dihydropteroate synthase [Aeromicrobium sp. CF3.5]|uniref:dihydropteroate synthase n=1 Tax=Aeromicrobium sp. CF3.5 TaxID=3373078 RepID=UPI003EE768E9